MQDETLKRNIESTGGWFVGEYAALILNRFKELARGIATGIVEVKDIDQNIEEEHYMHLERFEIALSSKRITEIAQLVTDPNYLIKRN